jgi:hypothetical protein
MSQKKHIAIAAHPEKRLASTQQVFGSLGTFATTFTRL